MIKQTKPDLEDLSRHAVREELRKIAEEHSGTASSDNSVGNYNHSNSGNTECQLTQDPALIALRAKLGGGMMKRYEMTDEQLEKILESCKPVPMIMLQCGTPRSPQENANDAWERLGNELGFNHMTVRPVSGAGQKVFEAEEYARRESDRRG